MNVIRAGLRLLVLTLGLVSTLGTRAWAGAGTEPVITGIRPEGTNLVITVSLPEGCRRVTLESRPRVGPGAWLPRRTQWTEAGAKEVVVTLPMTAEMEVLRAKGEVESDLPLPASFYTGRTRFVPTVTTSAATPVRGDGVVEFGIPGAPTMRDNESASASGAPRTVVESDIWQIDGSTLYFFNSARGLQVIDLTTPDSPALKGTLSFVAQGEQMYLLPGGTAEDRWLALLTSGSCDSSQGEIVLVRVRGGVPELAGRVPFAGAVRESRMVGTALYLALYRWRPVAGPEVDPNQIGGWKSETAIVSIDLADPARPVTRPERVIDAAPQAIQATDRYLFVATSGPATGVDDPTQPVWLRPGVNAVTIFDISDPAGAVEQKASVRVKGRVQDKFKMHLRDDVLTVVTSRDAEFRMVTRTNWVTRYVGPNGERLDPPVREMQVYNQFEQAVPMQTWLETFGIPNAAAPAALGSLKIIENESLFATRFVADRAYVVTFRQIDPLWIIDLSNPASPAIRGELQIPGYSSYLEPVGTNRLLAVGVDGGNATVALFDVSDESRPTQLSKVFLGTGWSWSEANSDEKAFKYLPEAGLVLVPWQGYENNQFVQAMQLVDYRGDRLAKRGVIPHKLNARRATAMADRIVSLSGQELLVVDAVDRDRPRVTADLDLSFNVSRVRVHGDHLVTLSTVEGSTPAIRRVAASARDVILGTLRLPDHPVVGFEMDGGRLHVMQFEGDSYRMDPVPVTNEVVRLVAQPPLKVSESRTNVFWKEQPPLVTYRTVTNVTVFPPLPTDPPGTPRTVVTNVYQVPVHTPKPPILTTNIEVVIIEVPQPSILVTNIVISTNWNHVTIPGVLVAREVGFEGNQPVLLGESRATRPERYGGAQLRGRKAATGLMLWSDDGEEWSPYLAFSEPMIGGLVRPSVAVDFGWGWGWRRGWGWWGFRSLSIVAVDVSNPGRPVIRSGLSLGGTETYHGFSEAFVADGRLHVSHREAVTRTDEKPATGDITGGPILPPGGWWITETRQVLDVVDFANPAEPLVRAPVPLPGGLLGISHAGALLYTSGTGTNTPAEKTELSALAYDGVAAALVDVSHVPQQASLRVLADGRALVGLMAPTNTVPASVEVWKVGQDGRWAKETTLTVPGMAPVLRPVGAVVVAQASNGLGILRGGAGGVSLLGVAGPACGIWGDWHAGDSDASGGVWMPMFGTRLVKIEPGPVLQGP